MALKIAVLSDIHGNLEALHAVMEDVSRQDVGRIFSLGDNVGYGPDPEKVTNIVAKSNIEFVLGNHEMALLDPLVFDSLNFQAQENNDKIRSMLSRESLAFYRGKPLFLQHDDMYFVHGFPPNSVTEYLFEIDGERVENYFKETSNHICFVGHTHRLKVVKWNGVEVTHENLTEGKHLFSENCKYIVNAGSVGQPRDRSNHAKYLIWDSLKNELEVRFVSYDFEITIEKIAKLGFPQAYGLRLK